MGRVLGTKTTKDGKVVFEVELGYEEALHLQGHIRNIHVFSEDVADIKTNLSQRGKNSATKYFLIPKEYRKGFRFDNSISCQRLDIGDKVVFVYVVDKLARRESRRELVVEQIRKRYYEGVALNEVN